MSAVNQSQKLHRFAIFTAIATLCLIALGGLVTSHQAGMSVPDWPTSYGYNMFYFPISQWVGGIFYEHTHRLLAVLIGLLTSILTGWIWWRHTVGKTRLAGMLTIFVLVMALGHRGSNKTASSSEAVAATNVVSVASASKEANPQKTGDEVAAASVTGGAKVVPIHFKVLAFVMPVLLVFGLVKSVQSGGALHWLGMTAFFAVILQGLLGGFRVALYQDEIGIFHATLAQLFLLLLSIIALMTSKWWVSEKFYSPAPERSMLIASTAICGLILVQLILGASMRHQHAGLAVPDFPLAYGKVWPATDADSVAGYNAQRMDSRDFNPITGNHVLLHMMHRVSAAVIWLSVIVLTVFVARKAGTQSYFFKAALVWSLLLTMQAVMGAWTVLSNKAADIATLHVVLGAFSFIFGGIITVSGFRCRRLFENVLTSALADTRSSRTHLVAEPTMAGKI